MMFCKLTIALLVSGLLAVMPLNQAFCECAVEGAVCGEPPTWNTCCEPDKYECVKDEGDEYGTCEEKEEADEAEKVEGAGT